MNARRWSTIGLVAAIVFFLGCVLYATTLSHAPSSVQAQPGPTVTTSSPPVPITSFPTSTPSPSPSEGVVSADSGLTGDPYQVDSHTCDKPIGTAATTSFQKDVFAYELVRLSPPSPSGYATLETLATSQYLRSHPEQDSTAPGSDETLTSDSSNGEALCSIVSSTKRLMTVVSDITTHREVNGQDTIVNANIHTPPHQTIWVLVKGVWKVNNE
jgi:hypothetical protein